MQLLNLTCPSCGASVTDQIRSRRVTCAYCGSKFFLDGENAAGFLEEERGMPEDESLSGLPMAAFAAQVCADFLANTGAGSFKESKKIRKGLQIPEGETVYLIHDDTMMKNGKNGFAITERGLYCRGMFESADFIDWAVFGKPAELNEDGSYISSGGQYVCYFTDSSDVFDQLFTLYEKLHRHAAKL